MTRSEIKIGLATLLIIGATALALHFGKPRLGNPGLIVENKPLTNGVGKVVRDERVFFPAAAGDFVGVDSPVADIELEVLPKDTTFGRTLYRDREGFAALMSAVLMKSDRSSIHRPETCVTAQGWSIGKKEIISIPIARPFAYNLQATALPISKKIRDESGSLHDASGYYIFWFVAEDQLVPRLGEAHWSIARTLLTKGALQRWAYVSCFATCRPGEEGLLLARMKRVIASTTPHFQTAVPRAQQTASIPRPSPLQ